MEQYRALKRHLNQKNNEILHAKSGNMPNPDTFIIEKWVQITASN
jgi:hypothetical protein